MIRDLEVSFPKRGSSTKLEGKQRYIGMALSLSFSLLSRVGLIQGSWNSVQRLECASLERNRMRGFNGNTADIATAGAWLIDCIPEVSMRR